MDEFAHYGVKGMKWGVRRYQNYDGTYTKRGVERYKKAESEYEKAKAKKSEAKRSGSKEKLREASGEVKIAKRSMRKAYKQLPKDKLADQGKELYKSGKTITDNSRKLLYTQAAIGIGGAATKYVLEAKGQQKLANQAASVIVSGGTIVNGILYAKTSYENKRLRAYYAH